MASKFNRAKVSEFNLINGGICNRTAAGACSAVHGRQDAPPPVGRRTPLRWEGNGSSLPMSCLFHPRTDYSLHRTRCQVPSILPHCPWISVLQEKMLALHSNPRAIHVIANANSVLVNPRSIHVNILDSKPEHIEKRLDLCSRGFCSVSNSDDECESANSMANPKEVERVCNVIEEQFALDRNMEAVLDECGVELSHDLVVDVLERFRHARRPAFRFFCWAGQRPGFSHDSKTYNSMMKILGKTKQFETMVTLLDEMGEKGLLTLETFQICIKAFAAAQQRKKAVGMFELMKKYNFKVGVDTVNCLLDNLGRAKLAKEAQLLFEKLECRFTPNIQTYTVLLSGWCRAGNLLEAGKVWNEMVDKGFKPDVVVHNTMLEALLKVHKRSDAFKLFENMKAKGPSPNVRSYTILIRDLCKQGRIEEAVECYEEMLDSGGVPDAAVFTCLITGFGNQKQMDKVYGLLREMKEKGCPPDGRMYTALIKLMTNRQMPDDAVRIYKKMIRSGIEPTIHTFNMMMKSFFRENYEMGHAVWEEMHQKGVCPDDNSYVVYMGGLIKQGRSLEACKCLEEMIEKGMKPPQIDYSKFAADFSRAGKPNILEELAERMRLEGKVEVSYIFSRYAATMRKREMEQVEHDPDFIALSHQFKATAMELISVLDQKQKPGQRTKVLLETVLVHKLADILVASFGISFEEQLWILDYVVMKVRLSEAAELVDRHLQSIRVAEKITQKVEG